MRVRRLFWAALLDGNFRLAITRRRPHGSQRAIFVLDNHQVVRDGPQGRGRAQQNVGFLLLASSRSRLACRVNVHAYLASHVDRAVCKPLSPALCL